MKIILLSNIKGLGNKSDVKMVSDGYARNFLIPKNLAKPVSPKNLKELEAQKIISAKKEEKIKAQFNQIKKEIEEIEVEFKVEVGNKQEMFASINESDIKNKIMENLGADSQFSEFLNHLKIILEKPIKKLGEYQIKIDLSRGVTANLKIIVKPLSAEPSLP